MKLTDTLRPLALGVMLLCGSAHAEVQPLDRVAAVVDNDVIMLSQLRQRVTEVQRNLSRRGIEQPSSDELTRQVLERLVLENLQLQIAERSGIRIVDEELNAAMANIAQRNGMSLEQFRNALAKDGLSYDEAREQVRREMIISRVRQRRVGERIQVSEQEVQNFLASDLGRMELGAEYRLSNIRVPLREGASSEEIQAAAAKAQRLYDELKSGADFARTAMTHSADENALDGGEVGWRKAAQLPPPFDSLVRELRAGEVSQPIRTPNGFVLIKLEESRGGSKDALREEVHVRHILIKPSEIRSDAEARILIERIYQRLRDGEDFSTLARSFSEDPGSARNGGDLDWVDPSNLVPEFREAMERSPIGRLTSPFKTQYGWHVLEVLDRRTTDVSEQARERQAQRLLRNRKYDEELQNWLRQIRDEAYVESRL